LCVTHFHDASHITKIVFDSKTPSLVHLLKQYQHEMLHITITKQDKEYGFLFASITYL